MSIPFHSSPFDISNIKHVLQGGALGWSLQMVDGANMTTGQTDQFCLTSQGGPLGVALVWHDPPALLSAQTALVNDLDLTVRAAGLNGYPLLVRAAWGLF